MELGHREKHQLSKLRANFEPHQMLRHASLSNLGRVGVSQSYKGLFQLLIRPCAKVDFRNVFKVYPEKYCKLVEDENGIKLLMDLIDHMETCEKLKELAQMVLNQCDQNNAKNFMEE